MYLLFYLKVFLKAFFSILFLILLYQFQCEKCNYLALIGGRGSDLSIASEKFARPPPANIQNLPKPMDIVVTVVRRDDITSTT